MKEKNESLETLYNETSNFIESLKSVDDPTEIIDKILNFTLEIYDADRAYIFESDSELCMGINTYEVCAEGVNPEIDNLQGVSTETAPRWVEMFLKKETLIIKDIEDIKDKYIGEYECLKSQDIQSLIAVPFEKKGASGYIGVDNPKRMTNDDNILKIISYLTLNALIELNLKKNLISSTKNEYVKTEKDVYIKTFGTFKIDTFLGSFKEEDLSSKQCFIFFIYLLINRKELVSIDKLTSIIWPNQCIYEPYGYVKNIAFRTRKMLSSYNDEDIIVAKDGSYACNDNLNIVTDYEIMEELYEYAKESTSEAAKVEYYQKIISIYEGSLLPKINSEVWLINMTAKYKMMYIDVIENYLKILYDRKEYQLILRVVDKAIKINEKIAVFHYYAILAYIGDEKREIAKEYLNQTKLLFTDEEYEKLSNKIQK